MSAVLPVMADTEIPFYPPHTESDSYKYLGVDIAPTFNWAPHLERILTETKHKAERLLSCAVSNAKKMRILRTAIDPSIAYSFAIDCMTELDISKFDAIRTRTCKRLNGLPVSTLSAMVHQDTDQARLGLPSLIVTYAEVSCRCLVQALNDRESLGLVTRHLLLLQAKAIGVALTQPNNKQSSNKHLTTICLPARNPAALRTSAGVPTRTCHPERKCTIRNTIQNTL